MSFFKVAPKTLWFFEENNGELQYLVTSLPSSGSLCPKILSWMRKFAGWCRMFQVSGFQNLTNMNMMLNVQQISWNDRALDAFFHLLWHLTPCGVSTDIKMWTSSPNTLRIRDARYETSQNYRTYGTDPKYAATSIKERSIPLRDHSWP